MPRKLYAFLLVAMLALCVAAPGRADTREIQTGAYVVEQEIVLPATPTEVYDAVTGDISAWWDHHFSEHPKRFYLEAKPRGCFCEIFNDADDGVQHATVIDAERGKRLRFDGPLGLSGSAVSVVTTYEFRAEGTGTRLHVSVHVAGEMGPFGGKEVDAVWHHFLFERLKPYIESGEFRKKKR